MRNYYRLYLSSHTMAYPNMKRRKRFISTIFNLIALKINKHSNYFYSSCFHHNLQCDEYIFISACFPYYFRFKALNTFCIQAKFIFVVIKKKKNLINTYNISIYILNLFLSDSIDITYSAKDLELHFPSIFQRKISWSFNRKWKFVSSFSSNRAENL